MTNDQLTQEVVRLMEYQAQAKAEHEHFQSLLSEIQEEVKTTKALAEDVHIMAINMQNLQKAQEETNKKVDALSSKEFVEYKENKKIIKQNIINTITGGIIGVILTGLAWLVSLYFKGGN